MVLYRLGMRWLKDEVFSLIGLLEAILVLLVRALLSPSYVACVLVLRVVVL